MRTFVSSVWATGVAILVCMGCTGSSTENSVDSASADSTLDTTEVDFEHPDSTPAPGTARVVVLVDSCAVEAAPPRCVVTVEKVLAYGMSTPTVSVSDSETVALPERFAKRGEKRSLGESLQPGNAYAVTIRSEHLGPPSDSEEQDAPKWSVVEIH